MAFSGTKRYFPIRFIGSGTMGDVYEVEDRAMECRVALKVLSGVAGTAIAQFKSQFRIIGHIHHDNLVQLYEMGSDGKQWFFTMELVQGKDLVAAVCLDDRRLDGQPGSGTMCSGYDEGRLRESFSQLALGLMALHVEGLVHRDIKPENVLVTDAGRLVILDFSLAHTLADGSASLEGPNGVVGTAPYMAPEVALGRKVSEAADWYAVGVLLYQVLTGRLPFDGPALDVLLRKQSERPPAPDEINPHCARDLAGLAMRLLDPEPRRRAGGQDVLAVLGRTLDDPSRHLSVSPSDMFVGRDEELHRLRRAMEQTEKSGPRLLLIEGSSGIGKTRLMEEFFRIVSEGDGDGGGVVFRGRCYERENMAYKAFDAVVDKMSSHLAHKTAEELSFLLPAEIWYLVSLFPVLNRIGLINELRYRRPEGGDPAVARQRAFQSFATLSQRLSRQTPVVVGIDDLQWADRDSMELLEALLAGGAGELTEPGRILVVATVRPNVMPVWIGDHIARLEDMGKVEPVRLEPLSRQESERLVMHLLDAGRMGRTELDALWVETILNEAGGNPFLMGEMAQVLLFLQDSGSLHRGRRIDLHEVVARRTQDLPPLSRRILAYVAVAEKPISQQLLSDAMGRPEGSAQWRRSMASLSALRLVRFQGFKGDDIVEAYHDRGRHAVLDMLEPAAVREIHADLARAMERAGALDPEALASHWFAAGQPGRAKDYLVRAARESVRKLAFGRASRLYETAVALEDDPEARHVLLMDLAESLVNEGRPAEAIELFDRVSDSANPNLRLDALHGAAANRLKAGYIESGLASLRPILEALGLKMPESGLGILFAMVRRRLTLKIRGVDFHLRDRTEVSESDVTRLELLWSLASSMSLVDPMLAAFFHAELWHNALRVGLPEYVAVAQVIESGTRAAMNWRGIAEGRRLISQAESIVPETRDPRIVGRILLAKGMIEHFAGEWEKSERLMREALELFRTRAYGTGWEVSAALSFLAWGLMRQGRVQEVLAMVRRELVQARGRRERLFRANVQTSLAILWLIEDRVEEAQRLIEDAVATWPSNRLQIQHVYALYGKTDLLLYKGKPEAAWNLLKRELPRLKRSALWRMETTRHEILRGMARSALALAGRAGSFGERKRQVKNAVWAIKRLRREKLGYMDAYAEHLDALRSWVEGMDHETVQARFAGAVGMLESANLGLYALAARRSLARISGNDEMLEEIDTQMRSQGVVRPDRIEAVLSPGVVSP